MWNLKFHSTREKLVLTNLGRGGYRLGGTDSTVHYSLKNSLVHKKEKEMILGLSIIREVTLY